jgi:hypothetical protein
MHDRHILHDFMTGKSRDEFARTDRRMLRLIRVAIGAIVVVAIVQLLI